MFNGVMLRGVARDAPLSPREHHDYRAPPRAAYEIGVMFTFLPTSFPNDL